MTPVLAYVQRRLQISHGGLSRNCTHHWYASLLDTGIDRASIRLNVSLLRAAQVYKGAAHPHSAQQPSDITSKINGSFNESQQAQ